MPDTWQAPFEMNQVCYDRHAKEFVRISNGRCTLDHSSTEAFRNSHKNGGCIYAPSEAIAYRWVGVTKAGDPVIAFTCRGVRPEDLQPAKPNSLPDISKVRRSRFIGRV
jgi:hypothetical protein